MNGYSNLDAGKLPTHASEHQAPLWWGMAGLIAVELTVFATLIASFFYLQLGHGSWPPDGTKAPDLLKPTIATVLLLLSAIPIYWGDQGIKHGKSLPLKIGPPIGIALAIAFLVMKAIEYSDIGFWWNTHAYGSVVWTIIGFHSAHVLALVLKTIVVSVLAWRGYFSQTRRIGVTVNGLYWYFVVIIWIPLYLTIYWSSHVLSD